MAKSGISVDVGQNGPRLRLESGTPEDKHVIMTAISALPDLLDAAEHMLRWAQYMGGWESHEWHALKKAVQLAGGEVPK